MLFWALYIIVYCIWYIVVFWGIVFFGELCFLLRVYVLYCVLFLVVGSLASERCDFVPWGIVFWVYYILCRVCTVLLFCVFTFCRGCNYVCCAIATVEFLMGVVMIVMVFSDDFYIVPRYAIMLNDVVLQFSIMVDPYGGYWRVVAYW